MSELIADTVVIGASPAAVWSILDDPAALGRVLPGCESIVEEGPGRFRAVLASKIQFLTVRADVAATYHDTDPPRHLRLELVGRPRGLAGSFHVSIPFDLEVRDGASCQVTFRVDLQVTGRLASFGVPLMRDALRRQVSELVRNVERELAGRTGETDAGQIDRERPDAARPDGNRPGVG